MISAAVKIFLCL